jgi:dienelactone hydrolase
MAEVVLFHSVLVLRPGVITAADRPRAAGHTVHTPDLYDGEVFDDLDDGMRKEDALGYREIARRAREAVAGLPKGLVFAGSSMGATHAELLAASRPGALGAVLMHGAEPVEALREFFGVERWPAGVPVQAHYAAEDPWVEAEEVDDLGEAVRGVKPSGGPGPPSTSTSIPAWVTSSPTRTCPSTIARRRRRCGSGCAPSWIGSTPEDRASKARPGRHMTTFLVDEALPA